jgi:hypothetical protein
MAVCASAPTMITLVLAIVADPAHIETAAGWNMLEPRGDDILLSGSWCSPRPLRFGSVETIQRWAFWP